MKILYLTPDFNNFYARFYGQCMRALPKVADVKFYNVNVPPESRDIHQVIKHLYGDDCPDVILWWDYEGSGSAGEFEGLESVKALKVFWSVDSHKDEGSEKCKAYLKRVGTNLILTSFDRDQITPQVRGLAQIAPLDWYPFAVDPEFYKPLGLEKKWDVALLGNAAGSYYPFRYAYDQMLKNKGFRYHSPETERFYEEAFVKHINESLIGLTCTSSYKYALPKTMEIMGCGTALFCDTCSDFKHLHFVDGQNYVDVNPGNVVEKIQYYLGHREELDRVAKNGRETVLQYHTADIRAREFVETLKKYV